MHRTRRRSWALLAVAVLSGALLNAVTTATASADPPPAGTFQALRPARILDTRSGIGAPIHTIAANHALTLQVTGRAGVPATNVAAVVLNVTVVSPTSTGYVTVYPADHARPNASSLDFRKGQTVPNLVTVPVAAATGRVNLYNSSGGTVNLVADVSGYYIGGTPTDPGTFKALNPVRILDTRGGLGAPARAVGPNQTITLQVTGRGGVLAGASAVALNVTVTTPKVAGYVTVYPYGNARPNASNLNFGAGQTVPNAAITKLPASGKLSLYNGSGGTVQLVADVSGYFLAGTPAEDGSLTPLAPARILDTRSGLGAAPGDLNDGLATVQVTGHGGVPTSNVAAVVLNVTVTQPGAPGYAGVYPGETIRTTTSSLNFSAHQTVANLVMVPVGADGAIEIYQPTLYPAEFVADVEGYVQGTPATPTLGAISGVVTSAGDPSRGVPNVQVAIIDIDSATGIGASEFTDSTGHYAADLLSASTTGYSVCLNVDEANYVNPGTGYLGQCLDGVDWDGTFQPPNAARIPVAVGTSATENITMPLGGAISGKVTSATTGKPATGAQVLVFGPNSPAPVAYANLAADGTYSVRGLPAGATYSVCFAGDLAVATSDKFVDYVTECYKNVPWSGGAPPSNSTKIAVAAGHLTSGINQAVQLKS